MMALPSPAEMYLPQRNEKKETVESKPVGLPLYVLRTDCAQSSITGIPFAAALIRVHVRRIAEHVYRYDRREVSRVFAKVLDGQVVVFEFESMKRGFKPA